ncbi:TonB-dependent receptor [Sphingomonas sp. CL5.1]|nr:TonB-dependent receptor [Sphingomonas sp. CL5.1]
MNRRSTEAALYCGAATLAIGLALVSTPAFAQQAPSASDAAPQQDIVVTGSRIARPDLEGTSPISIVSSADIAKRAGSANIENVLNDLPQVTPTTSSTSNNPGGGVATVNLRGLGSQRTLVMVDGRRYMSYDVNQIVDLNTIPSSLISRVDVVTGGQSAVYGSDAIAGVVNFILKRDFSGVELNSQYGVTEKGDGQMWNVNGTIGSNFDDNRGNVTLFVDYTKRNPTYAGQRDFAYNALVDDGKGHLVAAGGSPSVPQGRINIPTVYAADGKTVIKPGLGITSGLGCDNQDFGSPGVGRCYVGANGYNYSPVNYLQVPQERFLVSAMGQYEINEHFTPYFEAQFVNNRVESQLAATPIGQGSPYASNASGTTGPLTLQTNSPFFSPAMQAALQALDTGNTGYVSVPSWAFRTTQIGPRVNYDDRSAYRIVAGMKGDIGAGFSYDGYYMYARTKNSQRQLGNVAISNFLAATKTAFQAADGSISPFPVAGGTLVCADATARAAGCYPANIFGLNQLSPEAAKYISVGATNLEEYTTQVASFVVSNPNLFDLGAGGVGVAFGAEWRNEAGSVTPDTYLASGNVAGFNSGQPTSGSYSVREFFGEIRVPLLNDQIIHRLELNGAARSSHYSNAPGNVFTWSAGVEMAPVRDITFRGQYQKAVRGPSVNELYLGNTVSFAGNADQCGTAAAVNAGRLHDICVAQFSGAGAPVSLIGNPAIQDPNVVNPLTFIGGNPNLREETAKTYTVGAVIQPSFVPRLSLTVDYYNIKVDNFIHTVTTTTIGNECFINFNQSFCSLITRNAAGEIDTFSAQNVNSGGLKNSGIDVGATYNYPLGELFGGDARLSFNFNGTRLIHNIITQISGDPTTTTECAGRFGVLACGVPTPKWRHSLRTTLGIGAISTSVQWRYFGSVRDDDPSYVYASERLGAVNYFDLTLSADVNEHYSLNFGVSNLFNKKPPLAASAQNGGNGEQSNTYPTVYDVLGRSFFVSAKMKF